MKQFVLIMIIFALLAGTAFADTIQLDASFEKTNKWLRDNNLTLTGSPSGMRDDLAAFNQDVILFYGEGIANPEHRSPAQRELMAKRAAVVMAQRSLAEYLEGFALAGDTMVKDGMTQYDLIRSVVAGFIKGSQVVFQEYDRDKETAIAIIKVGLHGPKGFGTAIYEKMKKDPQLIKSLTEVDGEPAPNYMHKVEALDQKYDGLIIDATEQNFRPALFNRIFSTKGELLYDPSKVSQKILIEQGCGEYTNSVEKAKAALDARGVKNPLVIVASGSTTPSDLQVSEEDAVIIFSANQKGKFLAGARVAFVLQ